MYVHFTHSCSKENCNLSPPGIPDTPRLHFEIRPVPVKRVHPSPKVMRTYHLLDLLCVSPGGIGMEFGGCYSFVNVQHRENYAKRISLQLAKKSRENRIEHLEQERTQFRGIRIFRCMYCRDLILLTSRVYGSVMRRAIIFSGITYCPTYSNRSLSQITASCSVIRSAPQRLVYLSFGSIASSSSWHIKP